MASIVLASITPDAERKYNYTETEIPHTYMRFLRLYVHAVFIPAHERSGPVTFRKAELFTEPWLPTATQVYTPESWTVTLVMLSPVPITTVA